MTLAVLGVAAGVAGVMLPSQGFQWPTFGLEPGETPLVPGTYAAAAPSRALSATPPAAGQAGAVRRIYRHSVVPGGVADKVELAQILRTDRVVAAHYASFNVENARAVTVTAPRAVYVSYRKNDQIYWTSKKVMLEQGETLLTDGEHDIRARCANRISDLPQYPVETHGPSEAELDTVLAAAPAGEEGGMLAVAAGMDDLGADDAVGQRYYTTSFANGAGLVTLADASPAQARELGQAPGMPDWYNAPYRFGGVLGTGSTSSGGSSPTPVAGDDGTSTATPGTTVTPPLASNPGNGGSNETTDTGGDTETGGVAAPDGSGTPDTPGNPGGSSGGTPGGSGGGTPGGGGTGQPVAPTPSVPTPTPTPGGGAELPGVTPGTPTTPGTPGDTIVDPAAPAEVPEPGTLWLGGVALAAILWLRRKGARAS